MVWLSKLIFLALNNFLAYNGESSIEKMEKNRTLDLSAFKTSVSYLSATSEIIKQRDSTADCIESEMEYKIVP